MGPTLLQRVFGLVQRKRGEPRSYAETRHVLAYAPYEISIYKTLLQDVLSAPDVYVAPFDEVAQAPADKRRLFVRHDIDTAACALNAERMLSIDVALGARSGVYIRVDDEQYRAGDLREMMAGFRLRGLEIGLHTLCYLQDDYFAMFRGETEKFADVLGFRPRSFTVHGLGAFRYPVRASFQTAVVERLSEFGYELTDCEGSTRQYSYVIEDCHRDADSGRRFIYDDFAALPPMIGYGQNGLILTHPCYWQFNSGEDRIGAGRAAS